MGRSPCLLPHGVRVFLFSWVEIRSEWLKPMCAAGAKIAVSESVLRRDQKGRTTESLLQFGLQPRIVSETEGQEHKALGEKDSVFRGVNSF